MDIETGTVDVGDAQIYYRALGEGEPLLVLHNFGTNGERWMPHIAPLTEDRRVVVADLRGHGRSTAPTGEWSHRLASEDIAKLMDRLGHPVFDAIGLSSGAMALLHLAVRQPSCLRAVVLMSGTTRFTERTRAMQAAWTGSAQYPVGDEQGALLRRWFNSTPSYPDDMAFTEHHLSMVRARTLVLHGDRDVFCTPEIAVEMFRGIPNGSLCIVPGMGHTPVGDRAHELVLEIARDFLDKPAE